MKRKLTILFILTIMCISVLGNSHTATQEISIIIEVEGNPHEHKDHILKYHPFIEVIATYDLLFSGLALKGSPKDIAKISTADFIKSFHAVHTYQTMETTFRKKLQSVESNENIVFPNEINDTKYTGKGVKVAVIDTGIDYTHPDLANNYVGGYDLVDLDNDPMETTPAEGMPTLHGTHVAGIIAANGNLKGVAPDAQLYGYRALGPGGKGSSVQVIAALEQAVRDRVDIINLSLGNSINGPDYPTSIAVNKAVELGVAVVIANGNSGPNLWTVGSPATATNALAVGAKMNEQFQPFLYDKLKNKQIELNIMTGSQPWNFTKDYRIVNMHEESSSLTGKIAITERGETTFYEKAKQAEERGAIGLLVYNNEEGSFFGAIDNDEDPISIPVASILKEDGKWLLENNSPYYITTQYKKVNAGIAPFSSRGPVTVSWMIKPDILAPGTNIVSTVPNGYELLQGTSMAAPHVAGAIAVIKEAKPHWTNEQIIHALKTTATQMTTEEGLPVAPSIQGMGDIQLQKAIEATTLIDKPLLSFGKLANFKDTNTVDLTIENLAPTAKKFTFNLPKRLSGLIWELPKSFIVEGKNSHTISLKLHTKSTLLDEGLHEGWLTLTEKDHTYQMPYMFINQTADYPKTMGFDFSLKPFSDKTYQYQLYVTEPIAQLDVQLFHYDTLIYDRTLIRLTNLDTGINEGEVEKEMIGKHGHYYAIITAQLENGLVESYEMELFID